MEDLLTPMLNIFEETKLNIELIITIGSFVVLLLLILMIYLVYSHNEKMRKYVLKNSPAIKKLKDINTRYKFKNAKMLELYGYKYFSCIGDDSEREYFIQHYDEVEDEIRLKLLAAMYNADLVKEYEKEIEEQCFLGKFYDVNSKGKLKALCKVEKKLFKEIKLKPDTEFAVRIHMTHHKYFTRHTYVGEELQDLIYEAQVARDANLQKQK